MSVFAALLLTAATSINPVQCPSLPGVESLISQPQLRFIIVGEQHGTAEVPAMFGDLVCHLASSRKIVVGIEFAASMQPAIDRFMASNGDLKARREFLETPIWTVKFKDGRTSVAMFDLVDRLRSMKASGLIEGVVAFVPTGTSGPVDYEQKMAATLNSSAKAGHTVVALVGNIHALRTHWAIKGTPYMPMAGLLPGDSTATFDVVPDGGSQWACLSAKGCGPVSLGPPRRQTGRSLVFGRSPNRAYSGIMLLGGPASASLPKALD